jgi:hydrogenase expression/formation protein HypD
MTHNAKTWLRQLLSLDLDRPFKIMNVCGGHERTITQVGLRHILPQQIAIIPGPGCPVCVCPQEDIHQAIQLALHEPVTLVAFGDMLRVPANAGKSAPNSLAQARGAGADIRPIASPLEARRIAHSQPNRQIIFFATGFETTMAPIASLLVQGVPNNLSILLSGRLTWPAVSMLLSSETPGFDALVAPGHVATIMGPGEWRFIAEEHHMPAAIAGFTSESLLAATYSVCRQFLEERCFLDNCYSELVRTEGNPTARRHLLETMTVGDAYWRGIGIIPQSGFFLRPEFASWDARMRYSDYNPLECKHVGEMPPGCDCAQVVLGKIYPNECQLYDKACTPRHPIGPCMVSDEGACHIWWSNGQHTIDRGL